MRRGWAKEDEVIISGYSWGGFVTLLAMGKTPNEWAGGVAFVPIADWVKMFELRSMPNYLRALDTHLFGGTPQQKPDTYIAASPLTYVSNLQAPVYILAGTNDVRCPIEQVRSYVDRAQNEHKDVSLFEFESGHTGTFGNTATNIQLYNKIFDFVKEVVLGGG